MSDIGDAIGFEGLPGADKIQAIGEKWEKDHFADKLQSFSIREYLQQTISYLLPQKDSRGVVFIDDLDRCSPAAAMRLLEGLKIYLSIPNCVFVIGMNERIMVDAISTELNQACRLNVA